MEITRKKFLAAAGALFVLGVLLSVSNAYCAIGLGHVFAPLLYGIALAGLAAGAAIALMFQWKVDRMQLNKIIGVLPEDERKLLEIIIEKKTVSQTELKHLSGLPKVRISRILAKFEQRKIVEKRAYGNTNLIVSKMRN
jgi:hypothetical protein